MTVSDHSEPGTRDPDTLIRRAGNRGNPDFDQHFLVDDRVVDRIPGFLPEDADTAHILEIGGGPGVLTDRLLAVADHVTVIERDPNFAAHLREECAIVRLTPRDPDYEVDDEQFFLDFVKAIFTQRRKTIRNGIRNTAHISGLDDPAAVVEAADEDILGRRAGKVAPREFAALATLAAAHGIVESGGE